MAPGVRAVVGGLTGLARAEKMASVNLSWQQLALVVAGGSLGTVARYLVGVALAGQRYPWATTFVNLSGAWLFGLLWGAFEVNAAWRGWYLLLLTGFMGAYTTFSTFVFEVANNAEQGRVGTSAAHVAVHLVCGVGLVWLGLVLGRGVRFGGP